MSGATESLYSMLLIQLRRFRFRTFTVKVSGKFYKSCLKGSGTQEGSFVFQAPPLK